MSIVSTMDAAWQRRSDVGTADSGLTSHQEIAQATGEDSDTQSPVTAALESIMTYIPTEIVTTYVAVVAVLAPVTGETPSVARWVVFFAFLALTPLVAWLIYAAKAANANKSLPLSIATWPKWEMTAATVAYVIWAAALPNNPFNAFAWYSAGVAGIILLVGSLMMGLVAPIFTRNNLPT